MDKLNIVLVIAGALGLGYFLFLRGGDISGAEARRLVQEGARLVDVRTAEEFAAGHIEGAVNIPVQELERRMNELKPLERPLVLYCRSGNRSGRAASMLKKAGHTAVHDLGAIGRW